MQEIFKKINNNKYLFSIYIIVMFFGLFSILFNPLLDYSRILDYPEFYKIVEEVSMLLLSLPIIFIFKKKHIFNKPSVGFIKSTLLAWPTLMNALLIMISGLLNIKFNEISITNIIGTILLFLLVGIFEELLCRGWLLNEFLERFKNSKKNILFSIIMSSILFGTVHLINYYYGQPLNGTIYQVFSSTIFGLIAGLIYFKTKNMWSVIFIHFFWDFSISISSISIEKSISPSINLPIIAIILFLIINSIPQILNIILILNDYKKNNIFMQKNSLIDNNYKGENKNKRSLSIAIAVFIILLSVKNFNYSSTDNTVYIDKNPNDYSEHFRFKEIEQIRISKNNCDNNIIDCVSEIYQLEIELIEQQLRIRNDITNQEVFLKYRNVLLFSVLNTNDTYQIFVLVSDMSGNLIYKSNVIEKNTINNSEEYINELKNSFVQVPLPSICNLGYYEDESSSQKYPLFSSCTKIKYLLYPDGKIYRY